MCKLPSRKLLTILVAGVLFLPHTGYTLGVGEIEVNSALNQKLNADIELLSAASEDAENIIIKLASRKEFLRAGLDRPYSLNDLRFKAEVINDIPYIKVSSVSPIREPFLNFLIEVDWPNGHLLREYTVLLDPPVFMTQPASTASVATADNSEFRPASAGATDAFPVVAPTATGSFRPTTEQAPVSHPGAFDSRASQSSTFIPAPVVQQQTPINQPVGSYRIKTGDTAWSLAGAMRPDQSISIQQMMIAMLRANPESFINGNINGLKRGYILRVPDYDQIAAINDEDAHAMVREQAALWRQYQQSQAGGQAVSAMATDSSTGDGESESQSGAETADENAYLEIVSAGSGTSTISGKDPAKMTAQELRAELALARERVETERVEKEALQQRVDTLEQHAEKMKGMLSIEDEELSRVQSLNLPAEDDTAEMAAEIVDEVAIDTKSMEPDAVEEVTDEMLEEGIFDELAEGAEEGASEEPGADAVFTDEISEQAAAEKTVVAKPAVETVISQPQPDKRPPADLLTQLLNDPIRLAAAGGGLLLIAALIGIVIKRRKAGAAPARVSGFDNLEVMADNDAEETTDAAADAEGQEEVKVESLAGEQISDSEKETSDGEPDVASTEDTIVNETGVSATFEDDKPRDDVIAEADVYLAYGIYQQAEDLLTQAISENPDRNDYRIKLAETHYACKNADAFIDTATQIKQRVDSDDSPEWKKIMVMGQDLCADNSMFQSAMVDDLDVDTLAPETPSMDFDLDSTEVEDTSVTSDLDLSLDYESLELPDMDDAGSIDVAGDSAQILETEEEATSADIPAEPVDEIEFDLSDTDAVEETTAAEDALSLDIDASELNIDIQDETESVTEAKEESLDLDVIDIGLNADDVADGSSADVEMADVEMADVEMDFSLDNDAGADIDAPEAEAEEEVLLDLLDEVELNPLDMDVIEGTDTAANDVLVEEEDFDLSSLGDVDEISTKLDLARAYLDMGDNEGTRGILEEVLVDGNDEQKQEANDLMAKLA